MFMFRWLLFMGNKKLQNPVNSQALVFTPTSVLSCLPLAPQAFGMFHISPQNLFLLHLSFKPHSIKWIIQFLTFNFFQIQRFNNFFPSLKYTLDLVCTVALTIGESACYVTNNPAVPNKVLFSWRLVWSDVLFCPPKTPKLIVELKQQMLTVPRAVSVCYLAILCSITVIFSFFYLSKICLQAEQAALIPFCVKGQASSGACDQITQSSSADGSMAVEDRSLCQLWRGQMRVRHS